MGSRGPPRYVLDPALITTARPQDVVKEVMAKTGVSRNTAQRLTATLRADMRHNREKQARRLVLDEGWTKSAVAREVGLSRRRVCALFRVSPAGP